MKKLRFLGIFGIFSIIFTLFACEKDLLEPQNQQISGKTDSLLYSIAEIDAIFAAKSYQLNWETERDAKLIYSIAMYTDSMVAVGYKPNGYGDLSSTIHQLDLNATDWTSVKQQIMTIVTTTEHREQADIISIPSPKIPAFVVKVRSLETIRQLAAMPEVRYLEPMNDYFFERRGENELHTVGQQDKTGFLGCSCATPTAYTPDDAINVLPGVVLPWNYEYHHINEETWEISSGAGVGVAVIDSGVSFDQENLDSESGGTFNSGDSEGRWQYEFSYLPYELQPSLTPLLSPIIPGMVHSISILREHYNPDLTAHDRCGHGTRMAGIIAAPRGEDGNSVGVAYNCNLLNIRAVHNPIINTAAEKAAVIQSLTYYDPDIHIISMSIGQPPGAVSPFIGDALDVAYGYGKMLICAAGTSPVGTTVFSVLFPANHPTTIAITGIKEPASYPNALTNDDDPCKDCFYGEEVDFAVIMERSGEGNQNRNTLAVTCDGDMPSYSSGTSCATATFAGMAALVWSKIDPTATIEPTVIRELVLAKLQGSSSNPSGNHDKFGFGWVDVQKALED